MEREQLQVFRALHLRGEIADDGRVVQVAALRNLAHRQVMLDDQPQRVAGGTVEAQAPGHVQRQSAANFGMAAGARGLAGVVQQQREVEHERPLHRPENLRVIAVGGFARFPNPVKLFEANQGVFVGGVLVIELVLHQTGEPAEFRHEFAEKADLVHRAENGRHIAALVEDFQKRFVRVLIAQKRAVHQRELVANQLRHIRMEPQAALLGVEKHAH